MHPITTKPFKPTPTHHGVIPNRRSGVGVTRRNSIRAGALGVAVMVFVSLVAAPVCGKLVWINPGVGEWFDEDNWDDHKVPTHTDEVRVENGGTAQNDVPFLGPVLTNDLRITNASAVKINGNDLMVHDLVIGGNSLDPQGTLTVTGGDVTVGGGLNLLRGQVTITGLLTLNPTASHIGSPFCCSGLDSDAELVVHGARCSDFPKQRI